MSPTSIIRCGRGWFCAIIISDSNGNERQPDTEGGKWTLKPTV